MNLCCQQDDRRDAVRHLQGWNGLDYVEVDDNQRTLRVYFLGKLPPELRENKPGIEQFLRIEGGSRVTGIEITDADPVVDPDPEKDDSLVLELDKYGDYSTYTLRLVGVADVDPHYDHVDFSFKINCPSDLDCAPACACEPPFFVEPEINYLAKDYASFRQLIFDRLSLLVPDWKERHVPDLGVALVELLAYTGDYLSYYQDAVATEAYLDTARQRISVRRHARLVDYFMHEGCNARAWVHLKVEGSPLIELNPAEMAFLTGLNDAGAAKQGVLDWDDLRDVPPASYQVFEPLLADETAPLRLYFAHNEIHFYTRGLKQCCLERGSTSAMLLDPLVSAVQDAPKERALRLKPGDVLIFEEVIGPKTGSWKDADPARRQAVRLTRVTEGKDPTIQTGGEPTPYLEIEWAPEDALLFPFCLSAIGPAPGCEYIENISVARGNVVLADHGRTQDPEDLGVVPTRSTEAICECAGQPGDIQYVGGKFRARLKRTPLTYRQALPPDAPKWMPAAALLEQDVYAAAPEVWLTSNPAAPWQTRADLIRSAPLDSDFVVEIDNDGVAHLRFGDGELGRQPPAGMSFSVRYRIGNGPEGNVGADSISRLVLAMKLDGRSVTVRNPLPARGGRGPEPIAEAKLRAPHRFRKPIERAIIAADYEEIAERNPKVHNASAELVWTGSWYEADVAIDPLGGAEPGETFLEEIEGSLHPFRRIGHDLHVERARYVPLHLKLEVCALPHAQRAHIRAELLALFSNRVLAGGRRGFFHADNLTFGQAIHLSELVAAGQKVSGVECVKVTVLQRLFEASNREIELGVLSLSNHEIAQLENDPNYPERGKLEIVVRGGR
jgi:hypothetical protein